MLTIVASLLGQALTTAAIPPPPPPTHTYPSTLPPLHFGSMEMTCPVGGERFTAVTTTMWSITGQRPDGKPYSEVPFPRPLPECPGNGMVVFANFTPDETAELAKWISTPVYQSMRKTESPFYRAYWLAVKIHRPQAEAVAQLMPAIWEAKEKDANDPKRPATTRYQRVLVDVASNLAPTVSRDDRAWIKARAANALREMGKFDAAEKMRASVEAEMPAAPPPGLSEYLDKLKAAIARRDRSDDPLDMIPDVQAALICKDGHRNNPFDHSYCARPPIASIFKTVDLRSPPAVAARAQTWDQIGANARACHEKLVHKKLVNQDSTDLNVTYRLKPDTPEANRCMIEQFTIRMQVSPVRIRRDESADVRQNREAW